MKNVQVIDGASNCAYSVYEFTDEEFAVVFPGPGQDIEFIDDVIARAGEEIAGKALKPSWNRELKKPEIHGIHGTLFYELNYKKKYYPNKRESDIVEQQHLLQD